ncbi:hypothetical protein [Xenorhabdus sp. PB62.4]|uniref:hypothetical protein n=1 Tax=Xenorhabdus sp. PB62.4 TaxID=1851573 RepID=UPI0016569FEC|nr:hypothetical protein [Xenorhabdus sp. PB62.4]
MYRLLCQWLITLHLLDVVKENDLRLSFIDALKSPTTYKAMDRSVLQPRLLLCLYGLGTKFDINSNIGSYVSNNL